MGKIKDAWNAIGTALFGGKIDTNAAEPTQKVMWAEMSGGSLLHSYDSTLSKRELIQSTAAVCLQARASERSVLRFDVREFAKETELSMAIADVLDNINDMQDRVEFYSLCSQMYDAEGNCAIMLVDDDKGIVKSQYLMPSAFFVPRFESTDNPIPIAWAWADSRAIVDPKDLVLLRRPSLLNGPYKGRGVLEDDELNLKLLDAVMRSQTSYYANGGAPNMGLEFPIGVGVGTDAAKTYRDLWRTRFGPDGTANLAFAPDGGKFVNFGPPDMGHQKSRDQIAAGVRESFQIPRILLGDTDNVNHNNGQTAIAIFERTAVLRFGQALASAYQKAFRRRYHNFISITVSNEVIKGFTALPQNNGLVPQEEQLVTNAT